MGAFLGLSLAFILGFYVMAKQSGLLENEPTAPAVQTAGTRFFLVRVKTPEKLIPHRPGAGLSQQGTPVPGSCDSELSQNCHERNQICLCAPRHLPRAVFYLSGRGRRLFWRIPCGVGASLDLVFFIRTVVRFWRKWFIFGICS